MRSIPLLAIASICSAQTWTAQPSGSTASLRGVSAVNRTTAWASGTAGTILRTTDGGVTWTPAAPPDTTALDFRDIEATRNAVYAMSAGPGDKSRIYKTTDRGAHWTLQITNSDPNGFWDAIAFWDDRHGIVLGDPIDGRFTILVTSDGGATWQPSHGLGGFRSVVAWVPGEKHSLVALGPSGADWSSDDGRTWAPLDGPGFDTFAFAPDGRVGWAAGLGGRISKLILR